MRLHLKISFLSLSLSLSLSLIIDNNFTWGSHISDLYKSIAKRVYHSTKIYNYFFHDSSEAAASNLRLSPLRQSHGRGAASLVIWSVFIQPTAKLYCATQLDWTLTLTSSLTAYSQLDTDTDIQFSYSLQPNYTAQTTSYRRL